MSQLFTPFSVKNLHLKNRVVMAPMCQYSVTEKDGKPNDWHFVHYTSRAVGGAGLILIEMTDVDPDGRITDFDLGLWSDDQIPAFQRIINACHSHDAKIGIQIAHAGRKAEDTSQPVAPSAIKFPSDRYKMPRELSTDEVKRLVEKFGQTAKRAVQTGVDTLELHAAHGYLIHQFQSPLTNRRTDEYGQDLARFGVEVIQAVKAELPHSMPLLLRISAVEYADNGYGLEHSSAIAQQYKKAGVDVLHVSSGGEGPIGSTGRPGTSPGYQIPFARTLKQAVETPVIAVGMLEEPALAESVIANGDADLVAIARGMLRDPYWSLHAARALKDTVEPPQQYARAF